MTHLRSRDGRRLLGWTAAALTVAAVVGLTYRRLYDGIDFTDESYYVVLPYRLVLGSRPFVDETSVTQQTASLLVYPFVRAYQLVAGTFAARVGARACRSAVVLRARRGGAR